MPGFPRVWRLVWVLAVCLSGEIALGQAYEVTNLCEFDVCGAATSGVVQGGDGNFYGLAADGATGVSQLYRMTPVGVLTAIYTFTGTNTNPNSLILGTDGNFYGTTEFGGVNGEGSLFRITPGGSFTLLFSSTRAAGIHPQGMVQGVDGKLYLTTGSVTLGDTGSIASFDLTTGTVVLLHDLSYLAAIGPLVEGTDGNFYGAMTSLEGQGGVFKISPAGDYKLLFNLPQQYGQFQMWSPLVEGPDGNFYGWISYTYGLALTAIYKISPSGAGSLVHEFPSGATPANSTGPTSALTVGSDGKLYGEYYTVAPDYGDKPGELYFFSLTTEGSFEQTLVDENEYGANVTAFIQGTDGAFYSAGGGTIQRIGNGLGKPAILAGPVSVTVNPAVIAPGETATLTWSVANAYGQSANLCFGSGAWSGVQAASGTKTITVETAGEYYYGLTCGGVESGLAELIVGSNRAASAASVQGPNPPQVIVGNALTLDATVTSASGKGPTPTGTVAISGNGAYFFTYPLSDGGATATFSTAMLTPGYLSMSVTYSGDSNYLPSSTGTPAVVLVQGTPAVIVTVPAVVGEGQPLTVSANVLPVNNGPIPTGTVTFTAPYGSPIRGGTVPLTNGKATITSYSSTAQQGYVVAQASYSGDTYSVAAQGSAPYTVEANTLISLTVSPNPVSEGQTTTLLATLTATSGISPTGTVTFGIPGLVIGTATVSNGAAMLSASSAGVPPGTYAVTATYNGDGYNGPATSAAVNVKVTGK